MITEITPQHLAEQGFSDNFPQRFWSKVNKTESCWIWTAATDKDGYGKIRPNRCARCIRSHRAAWILFNGAIPDGLCVLHNCPDGDNPSCVNPDHLWLGTEADNAADRDAKGRWRMPRQIPAIERWNHKLTHETAKMIRDEYAQGTVSQRALALRFGVCHQTIVSCLKGRTWKVTFP